MLNDSIINFEGFFLYKTVEVFRESVSFCKPLSSMIVFLKSFDYRSSFGHFRSNDSKKKWQNYRIIPPWSGLVLESPMGFFATKMEVFVNCSYWKKLIENIFCTCLYALLAIKSSLQVLVSKWIIELPQNFLLYMGLK